MGAEKAAEPESRIRQTNIHTVGAAERLAGADSRRARNGRGMRNSPGLKVLLIDDSALVQRMLKRLVKRESCVQRLFVAPNAADGYSLFKISRPDVVVLDLDLPDLHGLEILKMIKGAAPRCIVVILTSSSSAEMRRECFRHGADCFLNKDSEMMRMRGTMCTVWRLVRGRRGAGSERKRRRTEQEAGEPR